MKRILLIDDEIAVASVFETALKNAGYDVKIAADGKSGVSLAKQGPFDLILLDQMMPDMTGNDVLKLLKQDPATKGISVAMLTNFAHDDMVKQALMSGADDYILKYQVSTSDLVAKVDKMFGESGKTIVDNSRPSV